MSELYEFNANGTWISTQMGRYVREKAPTAVQIRVHPMQMKKIEDIYLPVIKKADPAVKLDLTLTQGGHVFAGLHLNQEQHMPDSEMRFYDAGGTLVAKIIGLER